MILCFLWWVREQYISLINGISCSLSFLPALSWFKCLASFVLQPTFTPSPNQQGAVKPTPHHCLLYVITTACSLLPQAALTGMSTADKKQRSIKTKTPGSLVDGDPGWQPAGLRGHRSNLSTAEQNWVFSGVCLHCSWTSHKFTGLRYDVFSSL